VVVVIIYFGVVMVAVAMVTVVGGDRWEIREERRCIQAPSVGDGVESMLSPPNIDPLSLIFPPANHVIFASRVQGAKKLRSANLEILKIYQQQEQQ
jgi:hypothetical protein